MKKFLIIFGIFFSYYSFAQMSDSSIKGIYLPKPSETVGKTNFNINDSNTLQYADIVINEVFADPSPRVDLPPFEFVELYNRSSYSINLTNWVFSDGSTHATLKNIHMLPDTYLILCKSADSNAFKTYGKYSALTTWPSLNNTGDFLSLRDDTGKLIFELNYSDLWYKDPIKKSGGYTLEMIDPYSLCKDLYNWNASKDSSGGTPGRVNSIYHSPSDTIHTKITQVESPNDTTLILTFNRLPDTTTLFIPQNYFIYNQIYYPKKVSFADVSLLKIRLYLFNKLRPGLNYKIDANNITDCKGQILQHPYNTIYYFYPSNDDTSRIRINEIFADPSPEVGLPSREYIELFNCSLEDVNLSGWSISDPTSVSVFPDYTIPAKSYIILCANADTSLYKIFGNVLGLNSIPSLNNSSDSIRLKNKAGRIIHEVNYNLNWYRDIQKSQGGWSLELINAFEDCEAITNWKASTNSLGGTPGQVNSEFRENNGIELLDYKIKNKSNIDLYFNRSIDADIIHPHIFYIYDDLLNLYFPKFMQVDSPYYTHIQLSYDKLAPGNYHLVINAIRSCGSYDTTIAIHFNILPSTHHPSSIYINELMIDPEPTQYLAIAEYIELYNTTDNTIQLENLILRDDKSFCILPKDSIQPGEYLLVCDKDDSELVSSYGKTISLNGFISLNNTADDIRLEDEDGIILDRINYTDKWYRSLEKSKGGFSLERIRTDALCLGASNWIASIDSMGGTPGRKNSVAELNIMTELLQLLQTNIHKDSIYLQFNIELDTSIISIDNFIFDKGLHINQILFDTKTNMSLVLLLNDSIIPSLLYSLQLKQIPSCNTSTLDTFTQLIIPKEVMYNDIIINEILFNPYPEGTDFIELYNRSNYIFDLSKFSFTNDTSIKKRKYISDQTLLFHPHSYKVFSVSGPTIENFYYVRHSTNLHATHAMPTMNDAEGSVYLLQDQKVIDVISYSEKMHHSFIENKEGVSLERKSFHQNAGWTSASSQVGYASPSYQNSQYREDQQGNGNFFIDPNIFSPSRSEQVGIHFRFEESDYIISVRIYNTKGQLIKTLVKEELAGISGDYYWNGDSEQGKVAPGLYIIHIESFKPEDKVQNTKLTVIVAP